ncbi:uncharacterized protein LOC123313165 [Coccinella septempunctata]|uniref:uncharacterized protein LOC123313165 n=1 Tax=Coccinella septempunctata TaxID=41139 RepID=UPI001D069FE5|nr:uncharacterized protein LOC123313165 [Coccinella septempunctata]
MDFSGHGCGCETQDSDNKGLCYVEGIVKDYTGQDLHENVWFSMKPPKHVGASSNPQVSARTVEVTRAELTGKANIYKSLYETSPRVGEDKHNKVNIQKRKAGVSFVKKRGE